MAEIISVRFRNGGKEYYFDPRGQTVKAGDQVIIETAKGPEFGVCCRGNRQVPDDQVVQPLRPMLRLADDRDRANLARNRAREREAFQICERKIAFHQLDMVLVRCECSFDGNKLLFFFTSEGRVDFRALVKDLASTLHARIELRQIGVRDEAKLVGGLGICGRPYCCNAFLEQFQPVSIKMAKTQGLSLNPVKISGACGRLMCCLKYEQEAYEDAVKRLPKNESFVETPDGAGTISEVDYLRERVKVRLEESPESPMTYAANELNIIRVGKGRRPEGYVQPPREELEKLRKVTPRPIPKTAEYDLTDSIAAALSQIDGRGSARKSEKPKQEQRSRPKQEQRSRPKQEQRSRQADLWYQDEFPLEERQGRNRRRHRGGKGRGRNGRK